MSTWLMKIEHYPQKSIVRSFIYLDQILFHCKLGLQMLLDIRLLVCQKRFHKLSQKAGNFGVGGLNNLRADRLWGGFTCILGDHRVGVVPRSGSPTNLVSRLRSRPRLPSKIITVMTKWHTGVEDTVVMSAKILQVLTRLY